MKHTLDIKPIFDEYYDFLASPGGKDPKSITLMNESRMREFARAFLAEVIEDIRSYSANKSTKTAVESLLTNNFNEFIKNTADSLKKIKDSGKVPNTEINVHIEEDPSNPENILVIIEDYGKGFIDRHTGQPLVSHMSYDDYQDVIGRSDKAREKSQLGGAGLGLSLSTKYLEKNEGKLTIGPRRAPLSFDSTSSYDEDVSPESQSTSGASLRITSPKTPYILSYDELDEKPLTDGERPVGSFFQAGSLGAPPAGRFGKKRAAQQQTQATDPAETPSDDSTTVKPG